MTRPAAQKILIVPDHSSYRDMSKYLTEQLGYEPICLDFGEGSIVSKWVLIRQLLVGAPKLAARLKSYKNINQCIIVGHLAYVAKCLRLIKLVSFERSYCIAFFLHSNFWIRIARVLIKLDRRHDHYIVFSTAELEFYQQALGLDADRLHYMPYGHWSDDLNQDAAELSPPLGNLGEFYFAGGYTNRDYAGLIKCFRGLPQRLVIICSHLNADVHDDSLPENITVLRDVPSSTFDAYVKAAKAAIIPLKRDTGASGQSVLLRLMRYAKPIIVTNKATIREYVDDPDVAYVINDVARDLPGVILDIERNPAEATQRGLRAQRHYAERFTRAAMESALRKILGEGI